MNNNSNPKNKKNKYYTVIMSICMIAIIALSAVGCDNGKSGDEKGNEGSKVNPNNAGDPNVDTDVKTIDLTNILTEQSIYLDNPSYYKDGNHNIAETDTGYFIIEYSTLFFLDKNSTSNVIFSNDSMTYGELIEKIQRTENFEHDAIVSGANSVFYDNDKIYTIVNKYIPISQMTIGYKPTYELLEINPQTHERKVLTEFNSESSSFVLTAGNIFVIEAQYVLDSGEAISEEEIAKKQQAVIDKYGEGAVVPIEELESATEGVRARYKLVRYNLANSQKQELREIPVPEKHKKSNTNMPTLQGYKDKVYIRMSYSNITENVEDPEQSTHEGQDLLYIYDLTKDSLDEYELGKEPHDGQNTKDYTFLGDSIYFNKIKMSIDDPGGRRDGIESIFVKTDLYGKNPEEIPVPEPHFEMISNGVDLFAVSSQLATLDESGQWIPLPLTVYKMVNNSWEKQYEVDGSGYSDIMGGFISISSTGDLFIHGNEKMYLIKDGEATKIIDYGQFFDY